jgi:hypothetical protein
VHESLIIIWRRFRIASRFREIAISGPVVVKQVEREAAATAAQ